MRPTADWQICAYTDWPKQVAYKPSMVDVRRLLDYQTLTQHSECLGRAGGKCLKVYSLAAEGRKFDTLACSARLDGSILAPCAPMPTLYVDLWRRRRQPRVESRAG